MEAKTLDRSLFEAYNAGRITLHEAAREFYTHGWTNYVDEDYTIRAFARIKTPQS